MIIHVALGVLRMFATVLGDLLLPHGCAGCGIPDAVLCGRCGSLFGDVHERPLGGHESCLTCAVYEGAVRHAILSWKDHDYEACDDRFADSLVTLVEGRIPPRGVCCVVPVPSSDKSIRRRGRWHTRQLSRAMVSLIRRRGREALLVPALCMRGNAGKSVEIGHGGQRVARANRRIHVRERRQTLLRGRTVVVVDDIVTTGATMARCANILRRSGAGDVICVALAHAVDRRHEGDRGESHG